MVSKKEQLNLKTLFEVEEIIMFYKFGSQKSDIIWLQNGWCENNQLRKQPISPISCVGISCWGGGASLTATCDQIQQKERLLIQKLLPFIEDSLGWPGWWVHLDKCRPKQKFLPHFKHIKLKKGILDYAILSFSNIEQAVSFKRYLLACHSSLTHIVVKVIFINNGIAGIDYFQIAAVLHNMILAAKLWWNFPCCILVELTEARLIPSASMAIRYCCHPQGNLTWLFLKVSTDSVWLDTKHSSF